MSTPPDAPPEDELPLIGTQRPANRNRTTALIIGGVVVLALLAIIFGGGAGQNWQAVGTDQGHPLALLLDPQHPDILYAGTEEGQVILTSDGGQTWGKQRAGLPTPLVISALAALPDDSHFYAGTSAGVFISNDSVQTWARLGSGLPDDTVDALAIGSADSQLLFAGTTVHGVYASRDGGQTWVAGSGLPANTDVYTLVATPNADRIYAGLIGAGIAVTSDGGKTWTASSSGLPAGVNVFSIAIARNAQGAIARLYAGTSAGLFASADGAAWTQIGASLSQTRVISVALDPLSPAQLYAGTDNGIYQSSDSGQTWRTIASGLPAGIHTGAVVVSRPAQAPGVLYAALDHIYRYPGQGLASVVGTIRVIGLLLLVGLLLWISVRQNRTIRALLPANEPPPGYRPRGEAIRSRQAARAHIRGGPPPAATVFPEDGGAMVIRTRNGPVNALFTPVMGAHGAVIFIGEGRQEQDGPAGAFGPLTERLRDTGILSLRLALRVPGDLEVSVADVTGTLDVLQRHRISRTLLVGWGFGAAVAIHAALEREIVQGVVAIALPERDTAVIADLAPCPVLLLHGADDITTPARIAQERYASAGEPKELVIFPGNGHSLADHRDDVVVKVFEWTAAVLAPTRSDA